MDHNSLSATLTLSRDVIVGKPLWSVWVTPHIIQVHCVAINDTQTFVHILAEYWLIGYSHFLHSYISTNKSLRGWFETTHADFCSCWCSCEESLSTGLFLINTVHYRCVEYWMSNKRLEKDNNIHSVGAYRVKSCPRVGVDVIKHVTNHVHNILQNNS